MPTICLLNEDETVVGQWELEDEPIVVGRGASAHVRIADEGLSRRHFMIAREGTDYQLRDLSSRNGTWLEGERVSSACLRHYDTIQAGRTCFRFSVYKLPVGMRLKPMSGPYDTVIIPAGLRPGAAVVNTQL